MDEKKKGLVEYYEDELDNDIQDDIEELPTLEDEEEDEENQPQSQPRVIPITRPRTKTRRKVKQKVLKTVPVKRKEKVKVKKPKKKKVKKVKKEVLPFRYPTIVEPEEAVRVQEKDEIKKAGESQGNQPTAEEEVLKIKTANPDTQDKDSEEESESSSSETESSETESESEEEEEIDYDELMAENYVPPTAETKQEEEPERKKRRRRNKPDFTKGQAVPAEEEPSNRRKRRRNKGDGEDEEEEDDNEPEVPGKKKKKRGKRKDDTPQFEHKVSNRILELQKRFGTDDKVDGSKPEFQPGKLEGNQFEDDDKLKIDMINAKKEKEEREKEERRRRRREKRQEVVEEKEGAPIEEAKSSEEEDLEENEEVKVGVEYVPPVIEEEPPKEEEVVVDEKKERRKRRKKNKEEKQEETPEKKEEVKPVELEEENPLETPEPKVEDNTTSVRYTVDTKQPEIVHESEEEIEVQEETETEISVMTEKEIETEVEVEISETEEDLDDSKIDQLNMIENVNPDHTFVQPERVVIKKGKKKIKRKKEKRKEPATFTKEIKVEDPVDFPEDDKVTGVREYEDCTDKDKNDIRKYIIQNREVKNPGVKAAEIDEILFRNLRKRPFGKLNTIQKVLEVMYTPIKYLGFLTILPTSLEEEPTSEKEKTHKTQNTDIINDYSRFRYLINPVFGLMFIFYTLTNFKSPSLIFYLTAFLSIAATITLILFFNLHPESPPKGKLRSMITTLGFITSLSWMWFLTDIIVSIVKSLHILFNYHYSIMMIGAVSFLAWVPVALGSLKIVRMLQAMPGYSGVIFNCLFIFGVSILVQVLVYGSGRKMDMWPRSGKAEAVYLFVYIIVNFLVVLLSYFMVRGKGWRYTSLLGLCLALVYNGLVFYTFIDGMIMSGK